MNSHDFPPVPNTSLSCSSKVDCREPAWGILPMTRSYGRALMARLIRPQVFPLEFPEHPPPKKIRICLLFHSSNILWKKSNQGFSLLHLKGMFQKNPSDNSLACLTGPPGPLTTCELLTAPQLQEAQSLKSSWRYRAFSKGLKIILVEGFHCWLNDCCQASIFFIF